MARLGSGVSEYLNPKAKSKWYSQVTAYVYHGHAQLLPTLF